MLSISVNLPQTRRYTSKWLITLLVSVWKYFCSKFKNRSNLCQRTNINSSWMKAKSANVWQRERFEWVRNSSNLIEKRRRSLNAIAKSVHSLINPKITSTVIEKCINSLELSEILFLSLFWNSKLNLGDKDEALWVFVSLLSRKYIQKMNGIPSIQPLFLEGPLSSFNLMLKEAQERRNER